MKESRVLEIDEDMVNALVDQPGAHLGLDDAVVGEYSLLCRKAGWRLHVLYCNGLQVRQVPGPDLLHKSTAITTDVIVAAREHAHSCL